MQSRSSALKMLLSALVLSVLLLPLLQGRMRWVSERDLGGYLGEEVGPKNVAPVDWDHWLSGETQSYLDSLANFNLGFRNSLIRLHNQYQWDLFRRTNAKGVVVGKNDYLFEKVYIDSHWGKDYQGEVFCEQMVRDFKETQDILDSLGIQFLLVLAPSKVAYHEDLVPEEMRPKVDGPTLYGDLSRRFPEAGVNVMDCDAWFRQMKSQAKYPLFPKSGTHWSLYGGYLAVDSLLRRIEGQQGSFFSEIVLDSMYVSETNWFSDYDIGKSMNLLEQPNTIPLAYPVFRYQPKPGQEKPRTLVIGDSFFHILRRLHLQRTGLGGGHFWYYNQTVSAFPTVPYAQVEHLDWMGTLLSHDQVLVVATVANLVGIPWGFNDDVKRFVNDPYEQDIQRVMSDMWAVPSWMDDMREKALRDSLPLEEVMRLDAAWQAEMEIRQDGTPRQRRILELVETMRRDSAWRAKLQEKAELKGKTLQLIMQEDAAWIADEEVRQNGSARDRRMLEVMEAMRRNPAWLKGLRHKAYNLGMGMEKVMWDDAAWIVDQEQ